ncbi:DNA-directed RNA polymerase [Synechococcus sp. UW140]|uniref:DNA-directed RNA polymerase n=1 Tax=Synechococcus sp. UW140 TaxID=368503 RepID=UPI000E0EB63F|nr:DNA-directed RNA polymerase [Synechococcus sp. UW140]
MIKTNLQKDFEYQSHKAAVARLEKQLREAKDKQYFSSSLQARTTIDSYVIPTSNAITDWFSEALQGRAKTTATVCVAQDMLGWMEFVKPEVIAAITLKSVFDLHGVYEKMTVAKAANFVGTRIEDEARFRYYELVSPEDVVQRMRRRANEAGSSPSYRRISTKLITEKILVKDHEFSSEQLWKPWSSHYRCAIGVSLIELCKSLGIVDTQLVKRGKKSYKFLDLSPSACDLQDQLFSECCEVSYLKWPLIDKPISWRHQPGEARKNTTGGYHTDSYRKQLPLCRGNHYRSEFGEESVKFLNTISETAWCIDHKILGFAQRLLNKEQSLGSFKVLSRDPRLDERMPEYLTALPKDHQDRKQWVRDKADLHQRHSEQRRKTVRSRQSVGIAQQFLKQPRFFLSWSNDYRGRVYAQQPWLSPHSTDAEKALIRFADGCKLDERGQWWAAQAIGAAYLGSRLNFNDRVQWTYDNADLISRVASDPYSAIHELEKAKEPWTFLQLCFEWHEVVITKRQHLWHIAVGADATASGLQLLSSMLRDETGMTYSNVLPPSDPSDPPQDSYLEVLRIARDLAVKNPDTAHLAEHLVHRAIGKTTMVMLYGAKFITVRDRVKDALIDVDLYPTVLDSKDLSSITRLVQEASAMVFPAAFKALEWLAKLAKQAVDNGLTEFEWTTPSDDTIRLREFKYKSIDIRTGHLGKVTVPQGVDGPDTKKIQTACPPSYIHSWDASLLKIAFTEWSRPIAVIHDCLKVQPVDMDAALENIRRGFYKVCEGDPLADLADSLGVTEEQLPRLTQGKGELTQVLDSVYLFN